MPRIPQYRRQRLPSTLTGLAPRPREAAFSAQEEFHRGTEELADAAGGLAGVLNMLKKKKESGMNDLLLSKATRQLSEGDAADTERMNTQEYENIADLNKDQEGYGTRRDTRVKAISQDLGLDADTDRRLQISSNNSYAAAEYRMRGQTAPVEKNMASASWGRDVVARYQTMPAPVDSTYPQWVQDKAQSRASHRFYLSDNKLDYLEAQALYTASSQVDSQGVVTTDLGMIEQADKIVAESEHLTPAQIQDLKNKSKSAKGVGRALTELQRKEAVEAERRDIDKIFTLSGPEFLAEAQTTLGKINTSPNMTVDEKRKERKLVEDKIKAIEKGTDAVTNQATKGDLERVAYTIALGTINLPEYEEMLQNARYPIGLNSNPDHPDHDYDYRGAWKAGEGIGSTGHWPSKWKTKDNIRRYIDGADTTNGNPATKTKLTTEEEKQFQQWYKEAVKQSKTPTIDDKAYDELRSLGITKFTASQAKGLSEASYWAKGQLVEITDDLAFLEALLNKSPQEKVKLTSERQLQLDNWSQFNRSMRLWRAENPEAVEGDYYIESRRKMPFYRARTEEEIISGALPTEQELSDKEKRRKRYLELRTKAGK